MEQLVSPIKDFKTIKLVQETLQNSFRAGVRNYTIFQVGMKTMLRVSDVLRLKMSDIYTPEGKIRKTVLIHEKKTKKIKRLYLKPVQKELQEYYKWINKEEVNSEWLFPSMTRPWKNISEKQFYKVMSRVGKILSIDYLGTHTMRKTGAYIVYTQTNYNIGLVMKLLNHSSEAMTLSYLGLDEEAKENILDNINFG